MLRLHLQCLLFGLNLEPNYWIHWLHQMQNLDKRYTILAGKKKMLF